MNTKLNISYNAVYNLVKNAKLNQKLIREPTSFKIRKNPNNAEAYRLYFTALCSNNYNLPNQIYYADSDSQDQLQDWKPLFDEHQFSIKGSQSLATDLLNERMRVNKAGVTEFNIDKDSGLMYLVVNGNVYSAIDDFSGEIKPKLVNTGQKSIYQIGMSPSQPYLAAGIVGSNVFVGSFNDETLWTNMTNYSETTEGVFAGVPSFVVQEEFRRFNGFWWCPVHKTLSNSKEQFFILFEHTNETSVDEVYLFSGESGSGSLKDFENHRYPKPGTRNARSELRMISFIYDSISHSVIEKEILAPYQSPKVKELFSLYEYLTRAGWTKDGRFVWVQLMNRLQTKASVFLIPTSCFLPMDFKVTGDQVSAQRPIICILEENCESDAWIETHDAWKFINTDDPDSVEFFTLSQVMNQNSNLGGYMDLFHVKRTWSSADNSNGYVDASVKGEIKTLTPSTYDVISGKEIFVDETLKTVFVEAFCQDPLSRAILSISFANSTYASIRVISPTNIDAKKRSVDDLKSLTWSSLAACSSEYGVFLKMQSDPLTTISLELSKLDTYGCLSKIGTLCEFETLEQVQCPSLDPMLPCQLLEFPMSQSGPDCLKNQMLYGKLFVPSKNHTYKNANGSFPTVHYVYGGPGVRLIESASNLRLLLRAQIMCHYGFAVFICDTLGSDLRGLTFAKQLKFKMGQIEVANHIYMLQQAAQKTGLIDLDRVGIYGHSYGGYLTLMAACQSNNAYKAFVACSPVVDWRLYDTAYTERYMGIPQDQEEAYEQGCVLTHAKNIPSDKCRLLVIHGGKDENVHFLHTSRLLSELNRLGKPYSFGFYPSSRHGITEKDQHDASVLCFLMDILMK